MLLKLLKRIKNKFYPYRPHRRNEELLKLFLQRERVFIFGGAESINSLNLKNFKENDLLITFGNFHEHKDINIIKPDIHLFAASHKPITDKVLTNWWERCNKKLPMQTIVMVENRNKKIASSIFKDRDLYFYSYGGNFPIDFTKPIISPTTATIVALQLAIYFKIKTIILLGVHHDWQYKKPYGHFYSHSKPSLEYYLSNQNISYFHKTYKEHLPKEVLYRTYKNYQLYESIKKYSDKKDIKIYNGDSFSNFDVFERIFIEELNNY